MRDIHLAAFRHEVGWVKRDVGTIYVGFAYLCASQQFEIVTKLANPTNLVVDRWLNPTYDPFSENSLTIAFNNIP